MPNEKEKQSTAGSVYFTSGDKIDFYQGYPVYYLTDENCSHLLPCGICAKTNAICPRHVGDSYGPTCTTLTGGKNND